MYYYSLWFTYTSFIKKFKCVLFPTGLSFGTWDISNASPKHSSQLSASVYYQMMNKAFSPMSLMQRPRIRARNGVN